MPRGKGSGQGAGRGQSGGQGGGQGRGMGRGQGRGSKGGNKPGAGAAGYCICPNCSEKIEHQQGVPCYSVQCPKCSTAMMRE